ncbi:hypothetical protein MUN78_02980 [Leucobacter allii]|uniref:Uncharacterized protein n=1 Tax=Leucobacter allii TaxID=2932247 RepID=A0ABY4FNF9_9MICO|nr:hypothetical protein [Leucobacter allii]UOQ57817.1 hypothetical protein MUN78_02980 [Leucobacter allii]
MRLEVTTDIGRLGDLEVLAQELQDQAGTFARRTPSIHGVLGLCLRSLPAEVNRRSFTRFDRRGDALDIDLSVPEESLGGATVDQQRELMGSELRGLLTSGFASRAAPWTAEQRSLLRTAGEELLQSIGWVNGRRQRATRRLSAGHALAEVSNDTGLPLGEVEDLYADLITRTDTTVNR